MKFEVDNNILVQKLKTTANAVTDVVQQTSNNDIWRGVQFCLDVILNTEDIAEK